MDEYVNFGDKVVHKFNLGQTQYLSRHLQKEMCLRENRVYLGEDIDWKYERENDRSYHCILINKNHVTKFLFRYKRYLLTKKYKFGYYKQLFDLNEYITDEENLFKKLNNYFKEVNLNPALLGHE